MVRVINKPKFAVLLAVYNGMLYLQEQLDSIFKQVDVDITIFVSVDVSTDGSEEWLNQLAAHDVRVKLLPHGEKFGGASRNFFRLIRDVDFSQFDYIAFADQDDYWYPEKLSNADKVLSNSNCDAYSSNVVAFWPDGKKILVNKAQPQRRWDFIFEAAGPGCTYVLTVNLMHAIKSRMLETWDTLQQISLHDWYCYAFARANGYKWFIDPKPSMLYRQHEKNQFGIKVGYKAYFKRFKNINNGWWLTQINLISENIGMCQNPFIKSWNNLARRSLIRLSLHAFQCRRKFSEQFLFFFTCLILAFVGKSKKCKKD